MALAIAGLEDAPGSCDLPVVGGGERCMQPLLLPIAFDPEVCYAWRCYWPVFSAVPWEVKI